MPPIPSAGLLVHRGAGPDLEVLIGHMGGPFWARKDDRAWSIPKGEYQPDEDPLAAARREFTEELGLAPPDGEVMPLGEHRMSNGKLVTVWAVEGDLDISVTVSNTFELEWPPKSGQWRMFPEIDRAAWTPITVAREKLVAGQTVFLDRLVALLDRA
jgi:predicted NUDIX family NTP pyrophosphohydrolase